MNKIKNIVIAVIVCILSLYIIDFVAATHANDIGVQEIWGKALHSSDKVTYTLFSRQFSSPFNICHSKNVDGNCFHIEFVQAAIDKSPSSTIMYHIRRNVGKVEENVVVGQIDELNYFDSNTTVNSTNDIYSREIRSIGFTRVSDYTLDIYFPFLRFNYRKYPIGYKLQICGIQPDMQRFNQNTDKKELIIQGEFRRVFFKILPEKKLISFCSKLTKRHTT